MIALPAMLTGFITHDKIETTKEERRFGELAQGFGVTTELIPEDFGIGTGGGNVRSTDDSHLRTVDHSGEGGATGVMEATFFGQGFIERHTAKNNVTELNLFPSNVTS